MHPGHITCGIGRFLRPESEKYDDLSLISYFLCLVSKVLCLKSRFSTYKRQKPVSLPAFIIMWRRPTLPGVTPVPSALQGLTSLFGMGRGGTPALGRLVLLYQVQSTMYHVSQLQSPLGENISVLYDNRVLIPVSWLLYLFDHVSRKMQQTYVK